MGSGVGVGVGVAAGVGAGVGAGVDAGVGVAFGVGEGVGTGVAKGSAVLGDGSSAMTSSALGDGKEEATVGVTAVVCAGGVAVASASEEDSWQATSGVSSRQQRNTLNNFLMSFSLLPTKIGALSCGNLLEEGKNPNQVLFTD